MIWIIAGIFVIIILAIKIKELENRIESLEYRMDRRWGTMIIPCIIGVVIVFVIPAVIVGIMAARAPLGEEIAGVGFVRTE